MSEFVRDYGLVLWNHVRHGAAVLAPGDALQLRFWLLAHDGDPREAHVAPHFDTYATQS